MEKRVSVKDIITIGGALVALAFHAGTFYAVKDTIAELKGEVKVLKEKTAAHTTDIKLLQAEADRNQGE